MAYSPIEEMQDLIGGFTEKTYNEFFEYAYNTDTDNPVAHQYEHKVWVSTPREGIDQGYRYANVKKTVVEIVVDEDEYGNPVTEKWYIKSHRIYRPEEV